MKIKVWNDNVHPYSETFRGNKISIAAKGFVELEYDDAVAFHGSFAPIQVDADGNPVPEGYKMLRMEEPAVGVEVKANPLMCQACRYLATSKQDLADHATTHADSLVEDAEAESEMKKRGMKKN